MKIIVQNLGALKQAEFELGDFTILCGGNNTGKTYATYALFGFLFTWRRMLSIPIDDAPIEQLLSDGVLYLELEDYVRQANDIIARGCQDYTQQLPGILATSKERFKDTGFHVQVDTDRIDWKMDYRQEISATKTKFFFLSKAEDSTELVVTLLTEKEHAKIPLPILKEIIADAVKEVVFAQLFPRPFIASAERTGAAIFRKELNFARNRLLDQMSQPDKTIDPMELLFKAHQDYALPVEKDVDFARELETIARKMSFVAEKHPDILEDFANIIGGSYTVSHNGVILFVPKGRRVKLSMDESSSAVRSLLDIGFYLHHEAQHGDILMVDEPELNLHPENQRRIARLFARLVNIGINVFITTHSDYIVKEVNTLIMLNHDIPYLKRVAEEEGYCPNELLSKEQLRVYIAEEALVKLPGNKKRTRCQTLTPADIDPELGIDAHSFDTTIDTMNRIQEAIVWGEA